MQKAILKESKHFYQFQNTPNNKTAAFTNRELDLGFINQPQSQIKANRQIILSELNLRLDQIVCPKQTHSDHYYIVEQKDKGRGAFNYEDAISDTDAFITKEKNIALTIFVADCLPVYIMDGNNGTIALAHCGWKSTQKSLLKKTLLAMFEKFESKPQDIVLFFGPAIRKCCFEVGEEFLGYFKEGISHKEDKIYLDLIKVNYLQAKEVGILEDNIFDSEICTYCQNDKFFSFRKEEDSCGRQMALIVKSG
ncbi:MAG: peptidoglycan editing factor PgeF [Candidatus Omnitrophota bacterium]